MPQADTTDRQSHSRLDDARDAASRAYGRTTQRLSQSRHSAAEGVEANPLTVLVGGLAVGVLAGALVPRTEKERQVLAPVGKRLGETAKAAIAAAREAGMAELDQAGLTKDGLRTQARGLVDHVVKAAQSAGSAASQAAAHPKG